MEIVCHHCEEHYLSQIYLSLLHFWRLNNATDSNRKLIQIHRQTLPTDTRHSNGHLDGGSFFNHSYRQP